MAAGCTRDKRDVPRSGTNVLRDEFSDAEMRAYDKFWDGISSYKTLVNGIKREQQREIETAKAKAEIAEARLVDTARKLKAMKVMSIEQIAEATGLTAEEIERL